MPKRNLAARAGHWSARHRKTAIFGWLAFVVIAFVLGGAIGTNSLEDEDTGNGSSAVADKAIANADFPDKADEQILITARGGKLTAADPQFRAGVDAVVAQLEKTPHTSEIQSPFADGNEGQISKDQDAALVTFSIPGDGELTDERVDATLAATQAGSEATPRPAHRAVRRRLRGQGPQRLASTTTSSARSSSPSRSRCSSSIFAFGALVAAGVPLLLGITAVIGTLGLVGPISQIVPMEESAASVILLIGLAVGVDYSMFYLRRKMEERDAGRSSEAALEFAAATSGKAVLVSGLTVLIAMAGMFIAGNAVFTSFAIGTMLVVAVAMIGSVTVLPGRPVQARRQRREGPRAVHQPPAPPQPRRVPRVGLRDRPVAQAPRPGRRAVDRPAARCSPTRRCTCA